MNEKSGWWEDFFQDLWVDIQMESKPEELTRAEVDFIEGSLALKRGDRVLDVPCGDGRHSLELAARGYRIAGVDITLPFIEKARHLTKERGLEAIWERRDMRDLPWREEFDGAFCFWGSFGYFDDRGNTDFFRAMAGVLKPGSRFLLDTHVTETLLPKIQQERAWRRVKDALVLEERSYDHKAGRTNTQWILVKEGRLFQNMTSIRLYTYRELHQMFDDAGFSVIEEYGSNAREPFGFGSPRLYIVAVRR